MSKKFREIVFDHVDEYGVVSIDGYSSHEDGGAVIGHIIFGRVYWRDPEYQFDPLIKSEVEAFLKDNPKKFPNGFSCWMETHYEIVAAISSEWNKEDPKHIARLVEETQDAGGHGFLYCLAEAMTDEFENRFEGVSWGDKGQPDYFPTIEKYCDDTLAEGFDGHRLTKNM